MHTLLIEDNIALAQTVTRYLAMEDITCTLRTDGFSWYTEAVSGSYDVIILDIGLPEIDGIEICRRLRLEGKSTPIIMLTSRNTKQDIINGLDYGADDYLSKPCDYDELVARIRALSRRTMTDKGTEVLTSGKLSINLQSHTVSYETKLIDLSKREFDLLVYFLRNKERTIPKTELLEKVWGIYESFAEQKVVEVYIWYIRKKIPHSIVTEKWYGYHFNTEYFS
jgi:two-component system response regulator ArlR